MATHKGNIADLSDWKVVHRGGSDCPLNIPEHQLILGLSTLTVLCELCNHKSSR